ncbi:MAG: hypothetical protein WEE89_02155 [Gemmatimonadota bacterium]
MKRQSNKTPLLRSAAISVLAIAMVGRAEAQRPARWQTAVDARVFAQYMRSGTLRGADGFGSANWFMGNISRQSPTRSIGGQVMVSLEPLTLGECGYPRLLTPGFICFEHVLEDRQHTHPLIMDVSASVEQKLGRTRARLAAGLAGEPAFGPTIYFHRGSAAYDPISPLAHDRFNPMHTAYGLVTAGIHAGRVRAEASVFNGSAHDDDAYDLDLAPMHSYSGRASFELSAATRAQVSFANVQPSPGGGHHGHGADRMKLFSATIERDAAAGGLAYTIGWAAHRMMEETEHAGLLEAQWTHNAHAVFARAELAQRIEYEVQFEEAPDGSHIHIEIPRRFRVGEVVGGYALRLPAWRGIEPSIGARASVNTIPAYIRPRYDASRGFAFAAFTSLRPAQRHQH